MKFSGMIGFWVGDEKIKDGVYKSSIVEKQYTGDILKNNRRFQQVENQQNENLQVTARISVISNLYMQTNWHSIKYVVWNGVKWKVNSVDITSQPRAIIELGGVYNDNGNGTWDAV